VIAKSDKKHFRTWSHHDRLIIISTISCFAWLPLTAAGLEVRAINVVAASYLTECDGAFNNSKMHRMYLPYKTKAYEAA
jgi:hypothetical protein